MGVKNTEENENNYLIHRSRLRVAIEAEQMNLFVLLKPRIFKDGGQWCVLYGENLQVGIVGFGSTPRKAIWAFSKAWDRN